MTPETLADNGIIVLAAFVMLIGAIIYLWNKAQYAEKENESLRWALLQSTLPEEDRDREYFDVLEMVERDSEFYWRLGDDEADSVSVEQAYVNDHINLSVGPHRIKRGAAVRS